MAHYAGETLKERIGRGPLALDDAIDIATQVGQGLAKAHKAGFAHRDIKPANKSGAVPRWTPQNRPFVDTANPAISASRDGVEFYRTAPSDRKVVVTFVRQRRGPHLSTCA